MGQRRRNQQGSEFLRAPIRFDMEDTLALGDAAVVGGVEFKVPKESLG